MKASQRFTTLTRITILTSLLFGSGWFRAAEAGASQALAEFSLGSGQRPALATAIPCPTLAISEVLTYAAAATPGITLNAYRVRYRAGGNVHQAGFNAAADLHDWLRRAYPVPGVRFNTFTLDMTYQGIRGQILREGGGFRAAELGAAEPMAQVQGNIGADAQSATIAPLQRWTVRRCRRCRLTGQLVSALWCAMRRAGFW